MSLRKGYRYTSEVENVQVSEASSRYNDNSPRGLIAQLNSLYPPEKVGLGSILEHKVRVKSNNDESERAIDVCYKLDDEPFWITYYCKLDDDAKITSVPIAGVSDGQLFLNPLKLIDITNGSDELKQEVSRIRGYQRKFRSAKLLTSVYNDITSIFQPYQNLNIIEMKIVGQTDKFDVHNRLKSRTVIADCFLYVEEGIVKVESFNKTVQMAIRYERSKPVELALFMPSSTEDDDVVIDETVSVDIVNDISNRTPVDLSSFVNLLVKR